MHFEIRRKDFLRLMIASGAIARADAQSRKPPAASKSEKFSQRVLQDNATAMLSMGAYMGDRLGIFRAMTVAGPSTLTDLAARTGLNSIYLREWLGLMVTGNYVDYDPGSTKYSLPPERAEVLVKEDSPVFMGGYLEFLAALLVTPKVMEGFRGRKGPASDDYTAEFWESIERSSAPVYKHVFTQSYLTAPEIVGHLRAGGSFLDLGCGGGLACLAVAKAYPKAEVYGFDVFAPSIDRARANAKAAGLENRVHFETYDGVTLPARRFDVITMCYSVHHMVDPVAVLASAKDALRERGSVLILEGKVSTKLENNVSTLGNWLYGASLLYCAASNLTDGGPAYGALINESDLRDLSRKAGFQTFRRLPIDSAIDALYEIRA